MGYTYTWMHNNSMIPGETSSVLNVSILTESNVGIYRCEVKNSAGLSGSNTTTIELGGEYWRPFPPGNTVADWPLSYKIFKVLNFCGFVLFTNLARS